MEPRSSTLFFAVFGFVISVYALAATAKAPYSPPPPTPLPSPLPSLPALKPPSPPPSPSPPRPSRYDTKKPPPPPLPLKPRPPPTPAKHKINTGKKIGLLFAGIAAILQIGVVGFLIFKRRQLLKVENRYQTCS